MITYGRKQKIIRTMLTLSVTILCAVIVVMVRLGLLPLTFRIQEPNDENVGTLIRCITKVAKTQPMADVSQQ